MATKVTLEPAPTTISTPASDRLGWEPF